MSRLIHQKKTLSMMLTYQCTAECADCGTMSSPSLKEHISIEAALKFIDQAKQQDFGVVVFTGGEATLRWKDLLVGIEYASKLGMPSRLVTNAHWATSPAVAADRISRLQQAGLVEINYSTGDEHARFVPVERVVHAVGAALKAGMAPSVMVELRRTREVTKASLIEKMKAMGIADSPRLTIIESPWMPLDPSRVEDYHKGVSASTENAEYKKGCDSVLSTYTVQGNGMIGACCGLGMRFIPELNVGTVEDELVDIVNRSESDLLKLLIRYIGPFRILEWASRKRPSIKWDQMYGHHCQACLRIYQDKDIAEILKESYQELIPELKDLIYLEGRYRDVVRVAPPVKVVAEM